MKEEEFRALQDLLEERQKANETLHKQTVDQVNEWARTTESAIASRKEGAIENDDKRGVEKADAELAQVATTRDSWLRFEDERYAAEKSNIATEEKNVDEMRNRQQQEKTELADRHAGEAADRSEALALKDADRKQAEADRREETERTPVSDPAKAGIEMIATGLEVVEAAHAVYDAVTKGEVPTPEVLAAKKAFTEYAKEGAKALVDDFREAASNVAAWVVGSAPEKIDQEAREHTRTQESSEHNQVLREVHQEDVEAGKQAEQQKFENTQKVESQSLDAQHGAEVGREMSMLRAPPPEPPPPPKQGNNMEDMLQP